MNILPVILGKGESEIFNWFFSHTNVALLDVRTLYESVFFRIAIGVVSALYIVLWLSHVYEFFRALKYGAGSRVLWVRPKLK